MVLLLFALFLFAGVVALLVRTVRADPPRRIPASHWTDPAGAAQRWTRIG